MGRVRQRPPWAACESVVLVVGPWRRSGGRDAVSRSWEQPARSVPHVVGKSGANANATPPTVFDPIRGGGGVTELSLACALWYHVPVAAMMATATLSTGRDSHPAPLQTFLFLYYESRYKPGTPSLSTSFKIFLSARSWITDPPPSHSLSLSLSHASIVPLVSGDFHPML